MSFTSIKYIEPDQSTYKSVEITDFSDNKKIFDSGDFVKDWYYATKYIITELQHEPYHTLSSSVNHFIMDGDEYDSMWLDTSNEAEIKLSIEYHGGIEFFVNKGSRPSWEELRKYCGDEKK